MANLHQNKLALSIPHNNFSIAKEPSTGDISEDAERSNVPLGRVGKMDELGNLATFLMADGCEYLTGQTIAIDGAQCITGGGTFSMMSSFKDEDWEAIKNTIKGSNEKDKKQRTV